MSYNRSPVRYLVIIDNISIDKSFVKVLPPGLKFKLIRLSNEGLDDPTSKIACEYSDNGTYKILFNNQIWGKYGISPKFIFKHVIDQLKHTNNSNLTNFYCNWDKYVLIYLIGDGL